MKKFLASLLWLLAVPSYAQFAPGQVLTAAELNTQFALYAPLAGATFSGNVVMNGAVSGTGVTTLLGPYLTSSVAASTYAPLVSPTFTGTLTAANLAASGTVSGAGFTSLLSPYLTSATAASTYAPLASPALTGTPTAPTAAVATNTTQLATTAYVVSKLATPTAIGSGTANTGAFTTLSASSTVSGTGFSTYLASPPAIGTTTAAAGKFTTLQATSTITPSTTSGIVGTTLGDNANAGSDGEYIVSNVSGVSATSGTLANVTSITLTAGDWQVGCAYATVPAGSTTTQGLNFGMSTTTAAQPAFPNLYLSQVSFTAGQGFQAACPTIRMNVTTNTTVFLVAAPTFSISTLTESGYLWASRRR